MEQLFLTSFLMSLTIIFILIHRKFRGENFYNKAYYLIWIIIAIRLILPFDISLEDMSYNFRSPMEEHKVLNSDNNLIEAEKIDGEIGLNENIIENNEIRSDKNNISKETFINVVRDNIFSVWLVGMVMYLAYNLFFYLSFKYNISKNSIYPGESLQTKFNNIRKDIVPNSGVILRKSHMISSPMLLGIFNPVLLLPENISVKNIEYIFVHELIHLKRKDLIYKFIIFISMAIHWFNPVVHLMSKRATEDLELSCDEAVIRCIGSLDKI